MIRTLAIIAVCIFFGLRLSAQNNWQVDELVFPCVQQPDDIEDCLDRGARAFIFEMRDAGSQRESAAKLKQLAEKVVSSESRLLLIAFSGKHNRDSLKQELEQLFGDCLFIRGEEPEWPKLSFFQVQKKTVLAVFGDQLVYSSSEKLKDTANPDHRFSDSPLHKMVTFTSAPSDSLYAEALYLWTHTGRVPNLLLVEPHQLEQANLVADSLNKTRRFIGRVMFNDEYLNDVLWRQKPGLLTPGYFSYPILQYREILSPYKNGFRITPGEIIHHTAMKDDPRIFNAYVTHLDDQLAMDFSFDGNLENQIEPQWNGIISKDISFVKDAERGTVVCFSQTNSFIDYSKENTLNVSWPLSIAMWVQPDSLPYFMGMIGLGTSFSLKLNQGRPDFTTANIKDHMVPDKLVLHRWQHLAVVFDPNSVVSFFINGQKVGELNASEIKPSQQSLIVGNNIWGEQFYGKLDDLKIWNRGLSEEEVKQLYAGSVHNGSSLKQGVALLGGISLFVLFAGGIAYFFFRRRKKTHETQTIRPLLAEQPVKNTKGASVRLFGQFSVLSVTEGDISSRFSPLLKQMLAFFILNTDENMPGIDIQQLSDTFWPGASKEKAKENRSANLKKLRKTLENFPDLVLAYEDKRWFIQCSNELHIDLWYFRQLANELEMQLQSQSLNANSVNQLLDLLKNGPLLSNIDAEWLDEFKSRISEQIIVLLTNILDSRENLANSVQFDLLRTILKFDDLNEQALKAIIQLLGAEGKHGQARQIFDEFCRKYSSLYQSDFPFDFQEVIKNSL